MLKFYSEIKKIESIKTLVEEVAHEKLEHSSYMAAAPAISPSTKEFCFVLGLLRITVFTDEQSVIDKLTNLMANKKPAPARKLSKKEILQMRKAQLAFEDSLRKGISRSTYKS